MRLLATALCLGLVACASPWPAAVEEPPPAPWSSQTVPDSAWAPFALYTRAYLALVDSLPRWPSDSLRSFRSEPRPGLLLPRGLDDQPEAPPDFHFHEPPVCDRAIPIPAYPPPDSLRPVPMPNVEGAGPPPVPIPNYCGPAAR